MRKGKGELTYKQLKEQNKELLRQLNKMRNELKAMTIAHNKLLTLIEKQKEVQP